MSIYRKLDTLPEHRTKFAFSSRGEHLVKVNIPNMTYPHQHTDTEMPHGSRDHAIVPDTVKITFNFDVE